MKLFNIFTILPILGIIFISCNEKSIEIIEHPTICFNSSIEQCITTPVPTPSDISKIFIPQGGDMNIPFNTPFILQLSDNATVESLKNNLIILSLKDGVVDQLTIKDFDYNVDNNQLIITPFNGSWNENTTYIIFLKNGLKSDKNITFSQPLAFSFLLYDTPLIDENGDVIESLSSFLDNSSALMLETLRVQATPIKELLLSTLNIEKSDILFFYTVSFDKKFIIPCFNSKQFPGCENRSEIPIPSDFLLSTDGTLNIPIDDQKSEQFKQFLTGVNKTDGWSSFKPFSIQFSNSLDIESIKTILNSEEPSLFVFKRDQESFKNVAISTTFNIEENRLLISPIKSSWDEKSQYFIIFTNKIKGIDGEILVKPLPFSFISSVETILTPEGDSLYPSLDTETAQSLEYLRLQYSPLFDILTAPVENGGLGVKREDIPFLYSVKTRSISDKLSNIYSSILNNNSISKKIAITQMVTPDYYETIFPGIDLGDTSLITFGTIDIPYLLDDNFILSDQKLSLLKSNNGETLSKSIPILISFPTYSGENIVEDSKIIIFQHSIFRGKNDILPFLKTASANGYIVIAYDMVNHGDRCSDLTDNLNNLTGFEGGDGLPDISGKLFLSSNIFSTKDQILQSVTELFHIVSTLKEINFNTVDQLIPFSTIDPDKIYLLSHSFGSIIGSIFNSIDNRLSKTVLNVSGGGITDILLTAPESLTSDLFLELETIGISQDSAEFEQFIYLAQTVLDIADPINYKNGENITMIQGVIDDPFILNIHTEKLGKVLSIIDPLTGEFNPNYLKWYTINDGDPFKLYHHFSLLYPSDLEATTLEQSDIITFFETE